MSQSYRATCCLFSYGDTPDSLRLRLGDLLHHTPLEGLELRLGFSGPVHALYYALGMLCPDGVTPAHHLLPGGIERFQWTSNDGRIVRAWHAPGNLHRDALARLLCQDVPVESEYVVALEETFVVGPGWWQELEPLLDKGIDYIGIPAWVAYAPVEVQTIQAQPWYLGVPFEQREGRPGVWFMKRDFLVIRSERLREANYPDLNVAARRPGLPSANTEVLLGELARQFGWSRAEYRPPAKVTAAGEGLREAAPAAVEQQEPQPV